MLIITGIIIFLFTLSQAIRYGNPNNEVERKHWKKFIDSVVMNVR